MLLNVVVHRTEFAADVLMINIFQIYDGKYTDFLKDVMENTTKGQSAARNTVNICISKN